jgi:hypothetical protein
MLYCPKYDVGLPGNCDRQLSWEYPICGSRYTQRLFVPFPSILDILPTITDAGTDQATSHCSRKELYFLRPCSPVRSCPRESSWTGDNRAYVDKESRLNGPLLYFLQVNFEPVHIVAACSTRSHHSEAASNRFKIGHSFSTNPELLLQSLKYLNEGVFQLSLSQPF